MRMLRWRCMRWWNVTCIYIQYIVIQWQQKNASNNQNIHKIYIQIFPFNTHKFVVACSHNIHLHFNFIHCYVCFQTNLYIIILFCFVFSLLLNSSGNRKYFGPYRWNGVRPNLFIIVEQNQKKKKEIIGFVHVSHTFFFLIRQFQSSI